MVAVFTHPFEFSEPSEDLNQTRQFSSLDDLLGTDTQIDFGLGLLQGDHKLCEIDLNPILIGRDPTCHVVLKSKTISRFHCVIYRFGRNTVIRDLHSTNGVFLNQVKVFYAPLRVGDKLDLGEFSFTMVLGNQRKQHYSPECTVMFMDIADSTRLGEQYGERFSQQMHHELARIEDQIFWHQGCPIKHLGDGLMSAFGIWPGSQEQAAEQALRTATLAVEHMQRLPDFPGTRLRIGLAFGEVTLREQEGLDIFGDTVNLASRLEHCNKLYGSSIMLSDSVFQKLAHREGLREVDTVRVKGKLQPVKIYCWDERLAHSRNFLYTGFYHMGLEAYRCGDFATAQRFFTQAAADGDPVSQAMAIRVTDLKPSSPGWDGIWSLDKA